MSWSDLTKKLRRSIDNAQNLICDLCNKCYLTDFTLVHYCPDCIERLGDETYG